VSFLSSKDLSIKIKEILFSTSVHATEDPQKVREALLNLLPEQWQQKVTIEDTLLIGHAGNEIHLLEVRLSKNKPIMETLRSLGERLRETDKERLFQEMSSRIDQANCFYVRFDKQAAFTGQVEVDDADNTIRMMIKFIIYKANPKLIPEALETFGFIKSD